VDRTGSRWCPEAGSGSSGVEPSDSATRVSYLVRWILGTEAVRMGGGWNWLRIVSRGGLWYWRCWTFRFFYQIVIGILGPLFFTPCTRTVSLPDTWAMQTINSTINWTSSQFHGNPDDHDIILLCQTHICPQFACELHCFLSFRLFFNKIVRASAWN
jgi:hypothetical protein